MTTNASQHRDLIHRFVTETFGQYVLSHDDFRGDLSLYIKAEGLIPICEAFLEDDSLQVHFLADLTVVDWLDTERGDEHGRFEVVYNLWSMRHNYRFFLKVFLPDTEPRVASLTDLWQGANWMEREAYDLFGIDFVGHPNLEKILTPDDLDGFPLRKDFPLTYEVPHFTWNKDQPPEVIR